jgi:hypothetical protein
MMKIKVSEENILWAIGLTLSLALYLVWHSKFENECELLFGIVLGGIGLITALIYIFES